MSQQTYPVKCECGKEHAVTGGQAGSSFPCACRRTVEVPSLGALKRSVGQSSISADLEIEHRLDDGSLPLEDRCVLCGTTTRSKVVISVVCEQEEKKGGVRWYHFLLSPLFALAALGLSGSAGRQVGRNVRFRLPVRVCRDCESRVQTATGAREALERSELYARLLVKYPHAAIFPPL